MKPEIAAFPVAGNSVEQMSCQDTGESSLYN